MKKQYHASSFSPSFGELVPKNREGEGEAVIAIAIGGTINKLGLLQNDKLIDRKEIPAQTASGLQTQMPALESEIEELLIANQVQKEAELCICFSFAGLVDSAATPILSTNQKYDDGPDTDLVSRAKEKWNWHLYTLNYVRMSLLGKWQHGDGTGRNDLIMATKVNGINTAVLVGGELLIGKHFQPVNLGGHFVHKSLP